MASDILELVTETGQEWANEVRDNPLNAGDVLAAIPAAMKLRFDGVHKRAIPERAEQWMDRLEESDPALAAVHEEVKKAIGSDNRTEALLDIKARIYEGDFTEGQPVAVNGHH